mmetsp:Transcript_15993/g.45808  ORF Transcript_15993/g.45808 Transcript_15993/m.45808 type:complete len:311 (-) Transcript_15993:29-961(-)
MLVRLQLLVVRERNPVHTLQRLPVHIRPPESPGHVVHPHSLEQTRIRHVRTRAQIHHRPTSVASDDLRLGKRFNHLDLELVLREHAQRLLLGYLNPLEAMFLLDRRLHPLHQSLFIAFVQRTVPQEAVVVEPLLQRWPNRKIRTKLQLQRLAQQMGRRVPERLLAIRVIKRHQLQLAVPLQRPHHVPHTPIHPRHHTLLRQPLANPHRNIHRRRHPLDTPTRTPVGHFDRDLDIGNFGSLQRRIVLGLDRLKRMHPLIVIRPLLLHNLVPLLPIGVRRQILAGHAEILRHRLAGGRALLDTPTTAIGTHL